MSNSLNDNSLFIDFDSTFVKVETIDEIARITLQDNPDKDHIVKKISDITNQAMSGQIDFPAALEQRLQILSITDRTIKRVTNEIMNWSLIHSLSIRISLKIMHQISGLYQAGLQM